MADFEQVPGTLNITTTRDDDLSIGLTWSGPSGTALPLAGYTFETGVEILNGSSTVVYNGTVTVTDAPNGIIVVGFPKTTLAKIIDGVHSWYLTWTTGGVSRRVLNGYFILQTKKEVV